MKQRLVFLLLATFWVVMNFLLWQAEYGSRSPAAASIPPKLVWDKLLTAADPSTLEIFHKGRKIGVARWVAAIGEWPAPASSNAEDSPEGMVRRVAGYSLDFDGNVGLQELGGNLRFYFHLALDDRQQWRDVSLRLGLRPAALEIHANAARETVEFRWQDGMSDWSKTWRFAELKDPFKLLDEFDLAGPLGMALSAFLPAPISTNAPNVTLGLDWEARHDALRIAHTDVRAYRLEARLFGQYRLTAWLSRAGEILRVELPGDVTLINYALTTY